MQLLLQKIYHVTSYLQKLSMRDIAGAGALFFDCRWLNLREHAMRLPTRTCVNEASSKKTTRPHCRPQPLGAGPFAGHFDPWFWRIGARTFPCWVAGGQQITSKIPKNVPAAPRSRLTRTRTDGVPPGRWISRCHHKDAEPAASHPSLQAISCRKPAQRAGWRLCDIHRPAEASQVK